VTADETSIIRGVNLPRPPKNYKVTQQRDLIAARGGSISGINKQKATSQAGPGLIKHQAKSYLFVEQ